MPDIIRTKVMEALPERDGRKYVTYTFTTTFGDEWVIGPVLEDAGVDTIAKAQGMEAVVLAQLAKQERNQAFQTALENGENPADYVYKYNDKNAILREMYDREAVPAEVSVTARLTKVQNIKNKIKLFLGL